MPNPKETLIQRLLNRKSLTVDDPHGDTDNFIWLFGSEDIDVRRKRYFGRLRADAKGVLQAEVPASADSADPRNRHPPATGGSTPLWERLTNAMHDAGFGNLFDEAYDQMRDFLHTFEEHVKNECKKELMTEIEKAFEAGCSAGSGGDPKEQAREYVKARKAAGKKGDPGLSSHHTY